MGLETNVSTIHDLDADWPLDSDPRAQGAAHIRTIKSAIQETFPNINAVIPVSASKLLALINSFNDDGAYNANNATIPNVKAAESDLDAVNRQQMTTAIQSETDARTSAIQNIENAAPLSGNYAVVTSTGDKIGLGGHLNGGSGRIWFGYDGGGADLAWESDVSNLSNIVVSNNNTITSRVSQLENSDNNKLSKSGDSMSGNLFMNGNAIYTNSGGSRIQFESNGHLSMWDNSNNAIFWLSMSDGNPATVNMTAPAYANRGLTNGSPPASGDSSNSVPTTAWVQNALPMGSNMRIEAWTQEANYGDWVNYPTSFSNNAEAIATISTLDNGRPVLCAFGNETSSGFNFYPRRVDQNGSSNADTGITYKFLAIGPK